MRVACLSLSNRPLVFTRLYHSLLNEKASVTQRHTVSAPYGDTVIIGGGVIGLCTAFYLAHARGGKRGRITIVDRAPELFLGASGKCNGVLGDYGFSDEVAPLGSLSWQLHHRLANAYGGVERWGFSAMVVHRPEKVRNNTEMKHHGPEDSSNMPMPPWFHSPVKFIDHLESNPVLAARISPRRFCSFLKEECERMGAKILLNLQVTSVTLKAGAPSSVVVEQEHETLIGIVSKEQALQQQKMNSQRISCNNLVIAAGPWSQRVFKSLFPDSVINIPFDQDSKSGNSLLLKLPGYRNNRGYCDQVYLKDLIGKKVDLSDYLDGYIYLGGYLAGAEPLPEKVTDVKPQRKYIDEMLRTARKFLVAPGNEGVLIVAGGRAYRPVLSIDRPIITKVPPKLLALGEIGGEQTRATGGVFLNVGHGSDGMTLGPGSGLVMSELIQGIPTSADITRLGLPIDKGRCSVSS
ncbi:hypothetical protein GGR51DRAFT_575271 [Nemania sp. FL0031]|nr:hypothetical protein GGR51DRAFT_575271 [Nemania sp. FL0031]